jgi:phage baseplate assembly protein gpV
MQKACSPVQMKHAQKRPRSWAAPETGENGTVVGRKTNGKRACKMHICGLTFESF